MRDRYPERAAERLVARGMIAAVLSAVVFAACDSGPAELVRDIDAAREGCTEEMLKAADEECVRMFEAYADMAAGAMESYIGGMRAFDEAIRRRGGLQFDTAGLGNALGEGWRGPVSAPALDPSMPRPQGPSSRPEGYDPMMDPYYASPSYADPYNPDPYYTGDPYGPVGGGRWTDPIPGEGVTAQPYPQGGAAGGRTLSPAPEGAPAVGRRGVLLPPEERLQRPWIDDAASDDRYVEEGQRREPVPAAGGQGPAWYPYSNGASGGYPWGTPSPYPYGVPGTSSYPYPYGGTGSAYPYPQPYPYPYAEPYSDSRTGSW